MAGTVALVLLPVVALMQAEWKLPGDGPRRKRPTDAYCLDCDDWVQPVPTEHGPVCPNENDWPHTLDLEEGPQ